MSDLLHAFPGQETNEPVYVFARPYFIAFLPTALVFLAVFAFSAAAQYLVSSGKLGIFAPAATDAILFLGAFQLFALTVFFVAVLDFYYDIVVVTDRRMADIDQEQLFYRRISQLNLEDVEDATSTSKGFLPTLFNYGTVLIQTAGSEQEFHMDNVRFPQEIAAIVLDLANQAKEGIPAEKRIPQTRVIAVINDQTYTDPASLPQIGAMLPDDIRRVPRAAP
jgi:hypothetical protein